MDVQNKIFLFSIFFSFSFILSKAQEANCFPSGCRANGPLVRFPFRLSNLRSKECGYPGFDLSCSTDEQTILELPNSGNFTVEGIDYATQEIWIKDPNGCLPRRLLSFNLSGSPFKAVFSQNFSFFNCTTDSNYILIPVVCLTNSNHTVYAASSPRAIQSLKATPGCNLTQTVTLPVPWPHYDLFFPSYVGNDLRLKWSAPDCVNCESKGGWCGFKNNSTLEIACHGVPQQGLKRHARYAITVGVGVPSILLGIGLICFLCGRVKSYAARSQQQVPELSSAVAPQPRVITGLDGPTIESYPKLVLGESCRLPKPDDNTCSICLSEYRPKDTLRTIPECQHCFHADCIDEWLYLKATCPVCRNHPQSSPLPLPPPLPPLPPLPPPLPPPRVLVVEVDS